MVETNCNNDWLLIFRHLTPWFSILLLMGLAVKPVYGQGDWPSWGHDAGNQRHSPLTQINAENVSTLVPVWRYNMVKRGVTLIACIVSP